MNMKKFLAVAVILLFIGVAFAPSINANISKASLDNEMVEFTTEVYGLNGGKQTVKLTQKEAEEVEALFDSIREQLNATETRAEAEDIFKEAVVELDKYGLLGGLSVKQAQRLVTGGYQNSRAMKFLEKSYYRNQGISNDSNFLCLISGRTTMTFFIQVLVGIYLIVTYPLFLLPIYLYLFLYYFIGEYIGYYFPILGWVLSLIASILYNPFDIGIAMAYFISYFTPQALGHVILLGGGDPAKGWIYSVGMNGIVKWNGSLYGQLFDALNMMPATLLSILCCPFTWVASEPVFGGVVGFTGLKLFSYSEEFSDGEHFYLGSALNVKIDYEEPEFPWS